LICQEARLGLLRYPVAGLSTSSAVGAYPRENAMPRACITGEADIFERLRIRAFSLRISEPTVASDLEAAIRYKQLLPEERDRAYAQDPALITRLEARADRAIEDNQSPLAMDLQEAVELIRGL
jgi:hypothetical protein